MLEGIGIGLTYLWAPALLEDVQVLTLNPHKQHLGDIGPLTVLHTRRVDAKLDFLPRPAVEFDHLREQELLEYPAPSQLERSPEL
ncbi:hypothetical protein GGR58DRAFT_501070 [Xylaria digitata]|nr:hypothetical protein GGR58DRAFT_501070 [Xylaria digitata]